MKLKLKLEVFVVVIVSFEMVFFSDYEIKLVLISIHSLTNENTFHPEVRNLKNENVK